MKAKGLLSLALPVTFKCSTILQLTHVLDTLIKCPIYSILFMIRSILYIQLYCTYIYSCTTNSLYQYIMTTKSINL